MWRTYRVILIIVFLFMLLSISLIVAPSLLAQTLPEPGTPSQPPRNPVDAPFVQMIDDSFQMAEASVIITQPTSAQLAVALGIQQSDVITVTWDNSDPQAIGIVTIPLGNYFPTEGSSFVVLSSGRADSAALPNSQSDLSYILSGNNNSQGNDLAQLRFGLRVPNTMNCANLDFAFLSEEFPEYVGSVFNDTFTAEMGTSSLIISGTQVLAPNNFAFDTSGNVISVNTVFGVNANTASTYDGETPLLRAQTPVTPGAEIDIVFSVQDLGDSVFDSSVFLDKFFWSSDSSCNPGSEVDEDGDGLLSMWETEGLTVTMDGTDVFVNLPAMGANPKKKDIFIEMDYMVDPGVCLPVFGCSFGHSHLPSKAVINRVIEAFANAPVPNPDGTTGIVLHVDAGPDSVMNPLTSELWGSHSASNSLAEVAELGFSDSNGIYYWDGLGCNGTCFEDIKRINFSSSRAAVFHYVIMAHNLGGKGGTSGISREIGASDFIVSLGSWSGKTGTDQEQAGTFMHELGHNLGLRHSGLPDPNDTNFKPNYLSVMNYAFQTKGLIISSQEGHLDYSRFALPSLNENSLDEQAGLNGGSSIAQYGTRHYCTMDDVRLVFTPTPIDWNCDGDTQDSSVVKNINEGPSWRHDTQLEVLASYNDWQNLVYTGGAIGQPGAEPTLPQTTVVEEITQEEDATISALYDVTVVVSQLLLLSPGTTTTHNIQITNRGLNADTYNLLAGTNVSWLDLSAMMPTLSLAPGESVVIPIVAQPSASTISETGVMTIAVASQGNSLLVDTATSQFTVISQPLVSADIDTVTTHIADGKSQIDVSVQLMDYYSRPVSGASVAVTTTLGAIDNLVVTDASGFAIARLTASPKTGTATITAQAVGTTASAQITFVAGPPATVELTPEAPTMTADGVSTSLVTAIIKDVNGNPVPNQTVTFTTTLGVMPTTSTTTDINGIATVELTAGSTTGSAQITATASDASGSVIVNFVAGPPTALTLTATPTSLMADGASTATLTAVVKDANGNPVPNQTVAFATTLGAITNAAVTDANGAATATLTSVQEVGVAQVTASLGSLSASTEVTFAGSMFAGIVFADRNQNGVRDAGEPGIADVTAEMTLVSLAASSEQAATAAVGATWRTVSDAEGNYRFTNLPLGEYTLTLYFPRGYAATAPTTYTVTVGTGQGAAPEVGALVKVYLPSVRR